MSDPIPGAASEAVEQWNSRATTDTTIVPELVEALKWALDIIEIDEERIATLDPEGWKRLNHELNNAAKAKAQGALARAYSLPAPVGDWNAAIEAAAHTAEADAGDTCPFSDGAPRNDLLADDPCPVCGELGTIESDGDKCHGHASRRIASAIRALARPSQEEGKK